MLLEVRQDLSSSSNFTEFKKLSDFQVTKRNPVTKGEFEWPAPLRVEKVNIFYN